MAWDLNHFANFDKARRLLHIRPEVSRRAQAQSAGWPTLRGQTPLLPDALSARPLCSMGSGLRGQRVPDAHRSVARSGDEARAVGAPGDGVHEVSVTAQLGDLLSSRDVDQPKRRVGTTKRQSRAIRAEGEAIDHRAEIDGGERRVIRGVPEANGRVFRTGSDQPAVRAKSDARDPGSVPAENGHCLVRRHVPDPDGTVEPGRGERTVGGKCHVSGGAPS